MNVLVQSAVGEVTGEHRSRVTVDLNLIGDANAVPLECEFEAADTGEQGHSVHRLASRSMSSGSPANNHATSHQNPWRTIGNCDQTPTTTAVRTSQ
jgi:hypothetical protein